MALSNKQQAFINHYLTHWNATRAAIEAGYSRKTARSIAQENLTKPDIKSEIDQRLTEMKMSADEVLTRLADIARSDMGDFLKFEDGYGLPFLDLKKAMDSGKLKLVKKFKYNAEGRPEIELYDAQAALALLGKAHGLFTEKVEHSGPGGGPIPFKEIVVELPKDE